MGSVKEGSEYCFVCDEQVKSKGICMSLEKTNHTVTDLPTKISQLVGDMFMVIVREEDVVCASCIGLINEMDKLEFDLDGIKKLIIGFLYTKYNLNIEGNTSVFDGDVEQSNIKIDEGNSHFMENGGEYEDILSNEESCLIKSGQNEMGINDSNFDVNWYLVKSEPQQCKSYNETSTYHDCSFADSVRVNDLKQSSLKEESTCGKADKHSENSLIPHVSNDVKSEQLGESCVNSSTGESSFVLSMNNNQEILAKLENTELPALDIEPAEVLKFDMASEEIIKKQIKPESKKQKSFKRKKLEEVKRFRPILPKFTNLDQFLKLTSTVSDELNTAMSRPNDFMKHIGSPLHNLKQNSNENHDIKQTNCESKIKQCKVSVKEESIDTYDEFKCDRCQINFKDSVSLQKHMKHNQCVFVCELCGQTFKSWKGFKAHQARHLGRWAFCCDVCGRGFAQASTLTAHYRSHTKESPFICEVCGKRFQYHSSYWIHRKWHDNPWPYQCQVCGRKFKHTSRLAVHKRTHSGERPFHCPHCTLTFTQRNSLKRHMMLHTKEFPFTCNACDRGFTTLTKYRLHMSSVHSVVIQKHSVNKKDYKVAVYEDEQLLLEGTNGGLNDVSGTIASFEGLDEISKGFNEDIVEIVIQPTPGLSDALVLPDNW